MYDSKGVFHYAKLCKILINRKLVVDNKDFQYNIECM